ncbi:murein biosynthesis integral membrane protein MurJ [Candidatus Parcubacteria bacterium]|nr:murein biosynthesis integral membrane protein MurJ [Candidatus Parcubacteria bacterium]
MIKKLLSIQTKSVTFASLILAGSYLLSAFLGLFRDHFLAGRIGTAKLDVYYAAFTVPDLIALLLIFGAISAAIIPIFTGYLKKSQDEAWEYASALLNIFLAGLILVCGIFILFAPLFVKFIAPGFSPEKQATTAMLMRVMFLSPMILGISNIISGILQVFHRFLVTALAPVMYNVGILIGIFFFVPWFGLLGLSFGVVLGALLHLAIQIPAFWDSGFQYRLRQSGKKIFDFKHPGVVKTLKLMVPRSLGLGAGQINTIATTAIASTLLAGSIGIFTLANNLSNMIITMTAVSISTAIFPSLSLAYLQESKMEFQRKFSAAFLQQIFLTVLASVSLFLLRAQVVRVVLGNGRFSWIDTRLAAACLGVFAIGLCFQGLIFLLSKTFYAAHNTRIPAIVSVGTVIFNILMSLLFVWLLKSHGMFFAIAQNWLDLQGIENISVIGLALAYSVTGILESLLLLFLLYKYYKIFRLRMLVLSLYKIVISAVAMGGTIFVVRQSLIIFNIVQLQTFVGVFLQLALSGIAGTITYVAVSLFLGSSEVHVVREVFFNKFTKRR